MTVKQLSPGLWHLSANEEKLRVFGKVSLTEYGQLFGAYLMDTGAGYALIGVPPERYIEQWLEEAGKLAEGQIKWLILLGGEDDRGAARAVVDTYPKTIVVGSMLSLFELEGFCRPAGTVEVRTDRKLQLGKKTLVCAVLTDKLAGAKLYVVDPEDSALFTADAFCALCAADAAVVSGLKDKGAWLSGAQLCAEEIMAHRREETMKKAAALIDKYDVKNICPSRGPVADVELDKLVAAFTETKTAPNKKPTAVILYTRDGYLQEMADSIGFGVYQSGDFIVKALDLRAVNRTAAMRTVRAADAVIFGTAEDGGDVTRAMWDAVASLRKEDVSGKTAAIFVSTLSRSNAEETLRARLESLGCDLNAGSFTVQGKPGIDEMKNAMEFGFNFGCCMQKIPNPRKPKLVKCLVCGEIFDASMGICPVCGVGLDRCVPADEAEVLFRRDSDTRYVIVGGGTAAVSAAQAIRSRDGTGSIVILSAEECLPINRPMLSKDLQAFIEMPDGLVMHDYDWYDDQDIDLRLGQEVLGVYPQLKCVKTQYGEQMPYDKLILATGAESFVPPIPGNEKGGVLTLRHLGDALALVNHMENSNEAVVIGGGAIGLEAASELMRAGVKVTVLEAADQILGRQVDAETAALLRKKMAGLGVACYEGVNIAAIEGGSRVTGVRLDDGRVFPAQLVVLSCGNRANVFPAMTAGAEIDRAIVVDEYMRTSVEDIYACGDCAQLDGVNYQLWQEATEQGRVAGANAAGDKLAYTNRPMALTLEGFGTSLFAMGEVGKTEGVPYKTVTLNDDVKGSREKYWFFGGSLEGAVILGNADKADRVAQAIINHARYNELF